jgi:hypothetical protein
MYEYSNTAEDSIELFPAPHFVGILSILRCLNPYAHRGPQVGHQRVDFTQLCVAKDVKIRPNEDGVIEAHFVAEPLLVLARVVLQV